MPTETFTRREWLKLSAAAGAAAVTSGAATWGQIARADDRPEKRSLRIAHLTDSHTQPELRGVEGTIACLRHAQGLKPSPELIITGGDLIMDSFEATHDRTKLQWDLYQKLLRDECSLPLHHTLGNHDIWGWDKKKSGASGNEPEYGKKWALDVLGLAKPYYSFDRGGWHFIILDSVASDGDGYLGRLDEAQFEWLGRDLAAVPAATPVVVISHIPILAVCVLNPKQVQADNRGEFKVPGSWLMIDGRRVRELFRSHRNVRLCLSGHIHQLDRVDFEGVTYICDGAVCGAWWKGMNEQCAEGYGVVDLHPDGTWSHEYQTYGWKAAAS